MTVLVGTSGWQYRHWRYTYFRKGVPQNKWFEQVLRDFRTVELNVTFYRLPKTEVFAGWYALFSGLAFITSIGVVFAPVFHRFVHRFHLEEKEQEQPKRRK